MVAFKLLVVVEVPPQMPARVEPFAWIETHPRTKLRAECPHDVWFLAREVVQIRLILDHVVEFVSDARLRRDVDQFPAVRPDRAMLRGLDDVVESLAQYEHVTVLDLEQGVHRGVDQRVGRRLKRRRRIEPDPGLAEHRQSAADRTRSREPEIPAVDALRHFAPE